MSEWGQALHGKSRRLISALRQYGLLEDSGPGDRLSARAVTLLTSPHDSDEWMRAILLCTTEPAIFDELIDRYDAKLPSDGLVESYLVGERGFTPEGARNCIDTLRQNLIFAGESVGDYRYADGLLVMVEEDKQNQAIEVPPAKLKMGSVEKPRNDTHRRDAMTFSTPLTTGEATVEIVGEIESEDVEILRSWLAHVQKIATMRAKKASATARAAELEHDETER